MSGRRLFSVKSITAALLLAVFVGMGFFGPLLAPYEEDFQESLMKIVNEDGETEYLFSPARPTEWHILGTNEWGYDMLSLVLYGARYTVISVTLIAAMRTAGLFVPRGNTGVYNSPFRRLPDHYKSRIDRSCFGNPGRVDHNPGTSPYRRGIPGTDPADSRKGVYRVRRLGGSGEGAAASKAHLGRTFYGPVTGRV